MSAIAKHFITLPKTNRCQFCKEAATIILNPENPYPELLAATRKLAKYLTPLQPSLHQVSQQGQPYAVFRELPLDGELPAPPQNGKRPEKESWISEEILLSMVYAAGLKPLAYSQEKGVLVQEVAPTLGQENTLSNGGKVALGFHTDDSILKPCYRPEYLFLMGLVNEKQVPTYIAVLSDALAELSSRHQRLLEENRFRVELPESFQLFNGKVIQSEWRSLVSLNANGEAEIAGNLYAVKTKDEEARTAINALMDVLPSVAQAIVLEPGTAVVFSNSKVLHGRAAITSGKRWLQRVFAKNSLAELRRATGTDEKTHIFDIKSLVLE